MNSYLLEVVVRLKGISKVRRVHFSATHRVHASEIAVVKMGEITSDIPDGEREARLYEQIPIDLQR